MDQKKIGNFLRELRKNMGFTHSRRRSLLRSSVYPDRQLRNGNPEFHILKDIPHNSRLHNVEQKGLHLMDLIIKYTV